MGIEWFAKSLYHLYFSYIILDVSGCKDHPDCKGITPESCRAMTESFRAFFQEKCPIACSGRCGCKDAKGCPTTITKPMCNLLPAHMKKDCAKTCDMCKGAESGNA